MQLMDKKENNGHLLESIRSALTAGMSVMDVYESGDVGTWRKEDDSPLTEADLASHRIIADGLKDTGIPLLSEEGRDQDYEHRRSWKEFWLVDPLDGTKEFIKRNGEFTVNIALVRDGFPALGVVYAPALGQLYFSREGTGAFKLDARDPELLLKSGFVELIGSAVPLPVSVKKHRKPVLVASRSHAGPETEEYIQRIRKRHGGVKLVSRGSSLKICMVAEGQADVYPRFGPTMEWDTAAGHAVAKHSGCNVVRSGSYEELRYNKEDLHNPWFIVYRNPDFYLDP